MKLLAYALMAIGIIGGIGVRLFALRESDFYAVAGLILLAGGVLLIISWLLQLLRGEVKIRPFDALKKASVLLLILLGFRFLVWVIVPLWVVDPTEALIFSTAFATAYGFYTTAYRKSA